MEIQQLRYFVAIADSGSFSRAAQRCGVAQPSLSQQIQRLEAGLGLKLFDRLPRGVALTDAGSALLPRARRIVDEVGNARQQLTDDLAVGRGSLVVGAIPTMAPYLLPPLVRRFLERHPDCELSLREDRTEHLVAALLEDAVDLAVMSTPIDQPRIELEVVGDEGLLVAAAPSMPMPSPSSIKIEDLEGRPLILVQEVHCLGQQVRDYCHAQRIAARVVCEAAQISTVMRLVELGLGLSLVPEMAARAEPPGSARYWRLDEPEPRREIAVAWRAGRTRSRLAQSFVEVLRDELASGRHRCDPQARCHARDSSRSSGS